MVRHAREHRGLDLIDDQDVDEAEQIAGDRAGGCRVEDAQGPSAPGDPERLVDRLERDLELGDEQIGGFDARCRGADDRRRARAVGARRHDDRVLAARIEGDRGEPGRSVRIHVETGQVDAGRCDGARRGPPIVVVPHRADQRRRGPEARQRDRLVGALAADRPARAAPEHRLAACRQLVDVEEQVDVDAADDECTHGTRRRTRHPHRRIITDCGPRHRHRMAIGT